MTRVQQIHRQASALTTSEKAKLAADLLESLPALLDEEDEGLAEARRRDQELEKDPNMAVSWEQLRRDIGR
jgi:putative addiction module component (TIGR02574 family)